MSLDALEPGWVRVHVAAGSPTPDGTKYIIYTLPTNEIVIDFPPGSTVQRPAGERDAECANHDCDY